ncbi:hypothetical protein V1477_003837 [Vespula maculifrons]|uniref:Uncharacterized protein n=3 Tax=Vespula TaxID=7451 RepID=A0A834NNS9_VESGE|nr:hypothetical protein HZH66_002914 [Vespula vulgaris]KAF7414760.1 hypothetical protein HZH68_003249 [Vespula germanica]
MAPIVDSSVTTVSEESQLISLLNVGRIRQVIGTIVGITIPRKDHSGISFSNGSCPFATTICVVQLVQWNESKQKSLRTLLKTATEISFTKDNQAAVLQIQHRTNVEEVDCSCDFSS